MHVRVTLNFRGLNNIDNKENTNGYAYFDYLNRFAVTENSLCSKKRAPLGSVGMCPLTYWPTRP